MAKKTGKTSFWVHLLYCTVGTFLLLFAVGMVAGPEQVCATVNMIGRVTGDAIGAIVLGVIMLVMLVICLLSL